jgi:hypothetical protein
LDNGGSNYNYYDYECTVIGDNQEQSDLVSITNSNNKDYFENHIIPKGNYQFFMEFGF